MPKRSYEEKMDHYMRKIEKMREKRRRKRRRHNDSLSSSDQDVRSNNNQGDDEIEIWDREPLSGPEEPEPLPSPDENHVEVFLKSTIQQPDAPPPPPPPQQTPPPPPPSLSVPAVPPEPGLVTDNPGFPPLDPEILSALGEATDRGPTWGQEIHENLIQLWQPLLKKGMTKESKDAILKQYLIPSNCTLLQAPKLNIEISAGIVEMVRLRDKKVESAQQQLGVGLTAISRAMTLLLTSNNKVEAIKMLSDGCRILCDLHYTETQARIKMITPGLAKPFLSVIQDCERDETLFGTSLPEKIKASKTIEKQGLQIKKSTQPAKSNSAVAQNTLPARQPQFQGNWSGPPRYPMSRGGRGGQRRLPSTSRRQAPTTAAATSAQSRANQSRSRAPTRT